MTAVGVQDGLEKADIDVSVVIATHNGEATIPDQLQGLEQQDFTGTWEVVVVDNLSTDGTRRAVEEHLDRLPLTILEASDRPGTAYARNLGATRARGRCLLFCDDDDIVTPTWISAMTAALAGANAVGGRRDLLALNNADARYWRNVGDAFSARGEAFRPFGVGSSLLVERDVFLELGGFDEALRYGGEDVDLGIRLHLAGYSMAFADDALILYRLRTTPGAVGRQGYWYARCTPLMYKKYRDLGMQRRPARLVVRSWVWIVVNSWRLATRRQRGRWCWVAGVNSGYVVGSIAYRVVCL